MSFGLLYYDYYEGSSLFHCCASSFPLPHSVSKRKCLCHRNIIRLINHSVTQLHSGALFIMVFPVTEWVASGAKYEQKINKILSFEWKWSNFIQKCFNGRVPGGNNMLCLVWKRGPRPLFLPHILSAVCEWGGSNEYVGARKVSFAKFMATQSSADFYVPPSNNITIYSTHDLSCYATPPPHHHPTVCDWWNIFWVG